MSRYKNTTQRMKRGEMIRKERPSINFFGTTLYSKVPQSDSDIYITTQEGDRLDTLAFQFYGNQHMWWFIARTNNLKTINVPAGTSLRISQNKNLAKGF